MKTIKFIDESNKIHNNKYDYSKVQYTKAHEKVTIICPIHGKFNQLAYAHKQGKGCTKCGIEKNRLSIQKKIDESNKIHNNKYNYSEVQYTNMNQKVTIICPIHGEFRQTINSHLNGSGCYECLNNKTKNLNIQKANKIHNNKYDYSKVQYTNMNQKVTIICPIHGEFRQIFKLHLNGSGCPKCLGRTLSKNEKLIKLNKIHNNKYNYSKVNKFNSKDKVTIICPIHGEFKQLFSSHMAGHGCQKCSIELNALSYFNKPTRLYYIYLSDKNLYKIGITTKSIQERFYNENTKIKVLKEEMFDNGFSAYYKEQLIINSNKEYLYNGEKVLKSGNTELFTKNIIKG